MIDPLKERKNAHSSAESSKHENLIHQRFSKLRKLLSLTSIYIRFIVGLAKKKPELFKLEFLDITIVRNDQTVISALEMQNSRLLWISLIQQDSSSMRKYLHDNTILKDSSKLRLHPSIDKGLLRSGGRLRHSPLDYDEKYPLILPNKGQFIDLVVSDMYQRSLHGGNQLTLRTLRTTY